MTARQKLQLTRDIFMDEFIKAIAAPNRRADTVIFAAQTIGGIRLCLEKIEPGLFEKIIEGGKK